MDALERIDSALDKVLKASGSALRHYTLPATLQAMRAAMRDVISESYIQGSNDHVKAYVAALERWEAINRRHEGAGNANRQRNY